MHEPQNENRVARREKSFLVGAIFPGGDPGYEEPLEELRLLARTAGAVVVGETVQRRTRVDPSFFIGRGKAAEIAELVKVLKVDLIIFDNDLSPGQVRNLEKVIGRRVIDRSELILHIFATRAKTRQAKLQVEVAQLEYALPRLKRMWPHLTRIEGGIGFRGPGEKQLELDRRVIKKKLGELKRELKMIEAQCQRQVLSRRNTFRISLVGYTNAGKSTLMNALTGADCFVEDKLFATLDTRTKIWPIPKGRKVLLSDTVGFIRRIPHHLIASFHATLEETNTAHLLLHVVDASHPNVRAHIQAVHEVLREIGAWGKPMIHTFNKMDLVDDPVDLHQLKREFPESVCVSSLKGEGLDRLEKAVLERVEQTLVEFEGDFDGGEGRLLAFLFENSRIAERRYTSQRVRIRGMISFRDFSYAEKLLNGKPEGAAGKIWLVNPESPSCQSLSQGEGEM